VNLIVAPVLKGSIHHDEDAPEDLNVKSAIGLVADILQVFSPADSRSFDAAIQDSDLSCSRYLSTQ
jgi:hypothetical protein